jgi:antitoxin MazE
MAKANVVKWGNSLALRIPKLVAGALRIDERSEVQLEVANGVLVVTPTESMPEFSNKDLHRGLRLLAKSKRQARVTALDLGKPVGREVW